MEHKSKVKRYITLLKGAQNSAFVSLVCDNLKVELDQKPWKALKIMEFLVKDASKANSDFIRLKLAEGLVPLLADLSDCKFIEKILAHGKTRPKDMHRLMSSCLVIENIEAMRSLTYFTLGELLHNQKTFFADLLNQTSPLFAEQIISDNDSSVDKGEKQNQQKEAMKQMFMGGELKVKTDILKLSDFIDETFFDDEVEASKPVTAIALKELKEWITSLRKEIGGHQLFSGKRQKTGGPAIKSDMTVLSPLLGLLVAANDMMAESDWKQRQAAANLARIVLAHAGKQMSYFQVSEVDDFKVVGQGEVLARDFSLAILPQILMVMIKDHFGDFEELKVLAPVREDLAQLLVEMLDILPHQEVEVLLTSLPNLLKAIDQNSDNWITKYNFFLILKALFPRHKEQLLQMFGRVLTESLLHLEDEVRIIVTEILCIALPLPQESIPGLLLNLTKNLQQSDEIESSAISVFALISKIDVGFPFQKEVFCPFNFHLVTNVRVSYLQILKKCLLSQAVKEADLKDLARITLQSLAMERQKTIVRLNLQNLMLITTALGTASFLELISELFQSLLPQLLYSEEIKDFSFFLFFESKNFESIEKNYYKLVVRPVSSEEIASFHASKQKQMTKALSVLMGQSQEACASLTINLHAFMQLEGQQGPVHEAHTVYLMAVYNLLANGNSSVADGQYLLQLSSYYTGQEFQAENISLLHFKNLHRLQTVMTLLFEKTKGKSQYLQFLFDLMNQAVGTQRVPNLAQIGTLLAHLQTEVEEKADGCFDEMKVLFQSLAEYANSLCARTKQLSAGIQVQLAMVTGQITSQLGNIIKPILSQVKLEPVKHIQSIACHSLVQLIALLLKQQKSKAASQVLTLIVKDLEAAKDSIANRGLHKFFTYVLKHESQNILTAFNNHLMSYFQQARIPLLPPALNFLLEIIQRHQETQAAEIYREQEGLFSSIVCSMIAQISPLELPNIVSLTFKMFPGSQTKLVEAVLLKVKTEEPKPAFEILMRLLDDSEGKQHDFLKYLSAFVIPVIQNIQNSKTIFGNEKQVTLILAQLLSLLPLNLSASHLQEESKVSSLLSQNSQNESELEAASRAGFNFLQVFVNNQAGSESYPLEIKVKATLRDYQRQGITWLAQLGHYNLNCALCDDMGLGKTLQTLCVVLNEGHKQTTRRVSLIVCPTTITYNWKAEVARYFEGIKVAIYEGSVQERQAIITNASSLDLIIVSYDKLRIDIKQFTDLRFFYVILDEAHVIKNAKAKTTQAVKSIACEKKIVLTGTPLQNKVAELWSIFDFLMPGFLEEETVFNRKYNQYLTTNIKRLSEKLEETQQFVEAIKSLKKRIAPFILRRTKDQVLRELPPKVIQDVICRMPTFQEHVHQLVSKNHPIDQSLASQDAKKGKQMLQSLIIHRKSCNHPMFVASDLDDKSVRAHLAKKSEEELFSYEQSGKLVGLVEKLVECDIIQEETEEPGLVPIAETTRPHRALIFCQMSSMLQLIVNQVLLNFKIKHEQLLSRHTAQERLAIVDRFNSDESVRVLILTTAVGGLGLTLTGADTVIFAEHDWNPMKDLQAIDRAHRIGQTRQVCVYRLIVEDTLEEKIMNLQRFKENLARSLVQSKDSSTTEGLELTDLLASFQEHSAFTDQGKKKPQIEDKLVSGLEEIWQGGAFEDM